MYKGPSQVFRKDGLYVLPQHFKYSHSLSVWGSVINIIYETQHFVFPPRQIC